MLTKYSDIRIFEYSGTSLFDIRIFSKVHILFSNIRIFEYYIRIPIIFWLHWAQLVAEEKAIARRYSDRWGMGSPDCACWEAWLIPDHGHSAVVSSSTVASQRSVPATAMARTKLVKPGSTARQSSTDISFPIQCWTPCSTQHDVCRSLQKRGKDRETKPPASRHRRLSTEWNSLVLFTSLSLLLRSTWSHRGGRPDWATRYCRSDPTRFPD